MVASSRSMVVLSLVLAFAGCGGAEGFPVAGDETGSAGGVGPSTSGGLPPATGGTGTSAGPGTGGSLSTGGTIGGATATSGPTGTGGASVGGGSTGGASVGGPGDGGGGSTGGVATGAATTDGGDTGAVSADGADAGGDPVMIDCDAAMPTSGAQPRTGNGRGGVGNLAWEIWSNTGLGDLTTYDVPAFTASWNEAGGYLGRIGYEWGGFGDTPVPYEQHGTITAEFVANKSGTGGLYSYVGMYGWSTNPCVEWYVIDDSFNDMPVNPGTTTQMGEVDIDGGTYIMYTRPTTGSGGTRCSGVTNWIQYYSIRRTARRCGRISLTEHFDAWAELGMDLGNLLEAKILVEVGGGTGRVDLPIANVVATQ